MRTTYQRPYNPRKKYLKGVHKNKPRARPPFYGLLVRKKMLLTQVNQKKKINKLEKLLLF